MPAAEEKVMDIYSLLREFADSWVLLAMTCFFLAVVIWAFRPGSWAIHRDVADIPFRHEDRPATTDVGAKEVGK
jgi:cytochrome c oxidase cbb3-type subunit 4